MKAKVDSDWAKCEETRRSVQCAATMAGWLILRPASYGWLHSSTEPACAQISELSVPLSLTGEEALGARMTCRLCIHRG